MLIEPNLQFYVLMIILIVLNFTSSAWLFIVERKDIFHSHIGFQRYVVIQNAVQLLIVAYIFSKFKVRNIVALALLYYYIFKKLLEIGRYFKLERYIFKNEKDSNHFIDMISGPMYYTTILSFAASIYFLFFIFFMR